jgi:glycosyltransferase involved in cell wall biosynthesis
LSCSPIPILHLACTLDRGGIASSLAYLLPRFAANGGWQAEAAVFFEQGYFGRRLEQQGIPVHQLGLHRRYDPRALLRLIGLLRRGSYDVVHVHGFPSLYWVALASCLVRGPRYVMTEHNVTNRRRDLPWLRPVERWVYGRYSRIVAVSQEVSTSLVDWLPQVASKVRVIHNGVPPASFDDRAEKRAEARADLGVLHDQPVLLFVGGLHYRKGADVLIRAVADPSLSACRLLVCGEGELADDLRASAAELGLGNRVRFLGYRRDVPALMAAADLFVLPSRWEGCPVVILEAMAVGLPIVATAVGGVPELIRGGQEGLLVLPEDSVALAEAIQRLLGDPQLADRLGNQAKARAKREFSADRAAQKMAAFYEEMLEGSR